MGFGGVAAQVKRVFQSITPTYHRGQGGIYVTTLPHGAGLLGAAAKTLTAKGTALNYAKTGVAFITATANTAEGWVEGVVFANPQVANKDYYLAITTALNLTAVGQILAEVPYCANIATDVQCVPLGQRVYIPAGVAIYGHLADSSGGKTCDIWIVISRNK